MALTQFGETTRTLILKHESHKLHHEFEVGGETPIRKGQPVILNDDGTVTVAADAQTAGEVIGYSIHNGAPNELVTVMMRPFLIVFAQPNAALVAGPVAYDGENDQDPEFASFVAAGVGNQIGWALDEATAANDVIRVALF